MPIKWDDVLRWRVRRHLLDERTETGICAIARRLSGVHAQVMSSSELAISIRGAGLHPEHVRRALEPDRTLVKTWILRGTLHLIPADDFALWTAGHRDRFTKFSGAWQRYFGVTADDMGAILGAIPEALRGRALTR